MEESGRLGRALITLVEFTDRHPRLHPLAALLTPLYTRTAHRSIERFATLTTDTPADLPTLLALARQPPVELVTTK
jgi:hypothetical protein